MEAAQLQIPALCGEGMCTQTAQGAEREERLEQGWEPAAPRAGGEGTQAPVPLPQPQPLLLPGLHKFLSSDTLIHFICHLNVNLQYENEE